MNYSYFTKIMTRKPKIDNLTKVTKLCPFLESKKVVFKGILWSHDITWKPRIVKICKYSKYLTSIRLNTEINKRTLDTWIRLQFVISYQVLRKYLLVISWKDKLAFDPFKWTVTYLCRPLCFSVLCTDSSWWTVEQAFLSILMVICNLYLYQ